ncbi:MAG: laminin B domain-containing protein, partial [Chitinophagales bacterium]
MKHFYAVVLILLGIKMFAQPSSTFSLDCDGWTAYCEGACPAPSTGWVSINGNPGGCFKSTDAGTGTWYYYSSASFNTDLSSYYGSYLHFDLKQNTAMSQTNASDIMISKLDGSKIVYSTPLNPGTSWTSYAVPLTEVGWKYSTLGGASVTFTDFITFLSNVNYIKIRGDYSTLSTETTWLDNVNITPVGLLPIELNYFSGLQAEAGVAELTWETLSETNADYFQIEKSINGGLSFDSIGFIVANGTTTSTHIYNFYDNNFYTNAYYRLR